MLHFPFSWITAQPDVCFQGLVSIMKGMGILVPAAGIYLLKLMSCSWGSSLFMCLASLLERLLRDKLVKEIPFHRESFYVTGTLLCLQPPLESVGWRLGV